MTRSKKHIKGFYKLTIDERRRLAAEHAGVPVEQWEAILERGGLDPATADKVVENVLGTYALPFGVAVNFLVNDVERWVPMVVEEPSVIAAASNAAQRIRRSGGFRANTLEDLMTVQIEVHAVADELRAKQRVLAATVELLELARAQVPGLVSRGGGPRELEVRTIGDGFLVVHVHVDCLNAMGANLVNTIAEGIGPRIAELAQGTLGLRILTNLCDRRRVRVECCVDAHGLIKHPAPDLPGLERAEIDQRAARVAEAIEHASRFAELDPYRAATHNKGIMNGIDSVVMATGNDYRAVEAGAHAYAARTGTYRPLATWRRRGSELLGVMELPIALGIVGGTLKVHPAARLALRLLGVTSAQELAQVAAAAGLASNFSALRALATEGIQKGHMSLHARGVATEAGALGNEVEEVATLLMQNGRVNVDTARNLLHQFRAAGGSP
ncbi:MAG TPA: hydroxymethylglutaryl-CoA reductase, degradative [Polyangiaceae bacterium]|nr:hydroxymethylglutaryl-CoA reductase, degradative [Polyangiaceae bacterium]